MYMYRVSFRIIVKGGGANVITVELRGGEDTLSVLSLKKCLLTWRSRGMLPHENF